MYNYFELKAAYETRDRQNKHVFYETFEKVNPGAVESLRQDSIPEIQMSQAEMVKLTEESEENSKTFVKKR